MVEVLFVDFELVTPARRRRAAVYGCLVCAALTVAPEAHTGWHMAIPASVPTDPPRPPAGWTGTLTVWKLRHGLLAQRHGPGSA